MGAHQGCLLDQPHLVLDGLTTSSLVVAGVGSEAADSPPPCPRPTPPSAVLYATVVYTHTHIHTLPCPLFRHVLPFEHVPLTCGPPVRT